MAIAAVKELDVVPRGPRRLPKLAAEPSVAALEAVSRAAQAISAGTGNAQYFGYHRKRLALDFEWISQTSAREQAVCELGAYPFILTRALRDAGFDVYPVDRPRQALSAYAAAAELRTNLCDIETQPLPFPDHFFDHVLFNEVFEHLRIDLIFTAREIMRVLKPGGRLWLSTPNLRSLHGIVNFLLKGKAYSCMGQGLYYQYKVLDEGSMGHVREYTSTEVSEFLSAAGFSVDEVIYRGSFSNLAARLVSNVAPSVRPYFSVLARRQ